MPSSCVTRLLQLRCHAWKDAAKITGKGEKVVDLPGGGNHWTRDVIAGPEGKLLVSVGSASNIAEKGLDVEKNRATILEVDPQAKRFRIFAAGLRNPIGLALHPETGRLWTVVNERDMLGSDGPPDCCGTFTLTSCTRNENWFGLASFLPPARLRRFAG